MNPLTIQMIVKNNESSVEQALESIVPLDCQILVADIGSTDKTIKICSKFKVKTLKTSLDNDFSKLRNFLIKEANTEWNMLIHPWEMLIQGHENIIKTIENKNSKSPKHCDLLENDIITKPIRLWQNSIFVNPVFEKIKDDKSEYGYFTIFSQKESDSKTDELIKIWKSQNPLKTEPYYYEALQCLMHQKFKDFLHLSEYYFFHEKESNIQTTILLYYQAIVQLHLLNVNLAIQKTIICLQNNILMAEFWCLLGDCYFKLKKFSEAICFYENAIILGNKRLRTDKWPMHITKYQEYPEQMIESCKTYLNLQPTRISKQNLTH